MKRQGWLVMAAAWCTLALTAPRAEAQDRRTAMLDTARMMIDDFKEQQSIALLKRAIDPSLGSPDAAWMGGVQLLAQTLIRNNQREEAVAWLRWAVRLYPSMRVDSVTSTPALIAAVQQARDFVATSRPDPRTNVRYEWTTATQSGGFGDLRVERAVGDPSSAMQVAVDGVGFLDPGRPRRLAPGSYRIGAQVAGAKSAEVTTEVLPGVTTVVTVSLAPATDVLVADAERSVMASVARIGAVRGGVNECAAGYAASGSGIVLTTYRAIRGAESLVVQLAGKRYEGDDVRVAAWDVRADLAALSLRGARVDTLTPSSAVRNGAALWGARFPGCAERPVLERVNVTALSGDSVRLAETVLSPEQGAVLVDNTGNVAGLLVEASSALALRAAAPLVTQGGRNAAAGSLSSALEVARRERHAYGELALQTNKPGRRARVTPLDKWQWSEVARTDALPFTFKGPQGRYLVEVFDGERVLTRSEVVMEPSSSKQVALDRMKKGRSKVSPIVGGLAAGGIVAALVGGGGPKPPPPPSTGTIVVKFPSGLRVP